MGEVAEATGATMDAPVELAGCFINGSPAESQERPSRLKTVAFEYANGEALLCYGAPSANGREIFGGLEAFGAPWRIGANEATALHLTGAASIGGVAVEAGSYSLYAVPGEEEWQFFVNSNQMNFHVPPGAALGVARIEVRTAEDILKVGETLITDVFPNAFTFGAGAGAAGLIIVKPDGTRTDTTTIAEPEPAVSNEDVLAVSQFVTGTANAQDFRAVCEGLVMQLLGAAPTPGFLGLEQVAFLLDFVQLGGSGPQEVECIIEADGVGSNPVKYGYNRTE